MFCSLLCTLRSLLKTNAEDGCNGTLAHNDSATRFVQMTWANDVFLLDGAMPVESRRAGGVPGPMPQWGPPQHKLPVVTPSRPASGDYDGEEAFHGSLHGPGCTTTSQPIY